MRKKLKTPKLRNPMARALRDPLFKSRVVRSGKTYDRNVEKKKVKKELDTSGNIC